MRACYTAMLQLIQGLKGSPQPAPVFLHALAAGNAGDYQQGTDWLDIERLVEFGLGYGVRFREERELLMRVGLEHSQELEESWLQQHGDTLTSFRPKAR